MKNILIIKTGALGDVLRTSSILYGLKEKYPVSRICWITSNAAFPLIKDHPLISSFFVHNSGLSWNSPTFDLVINLEEDPKIFQKYYNDLNYMKWVGPYTLLDKIYYTDDFSPIYDMSLISKFGKDVADLEKKSNKKSYPELLYQCLGLTWERQQYHIYGCYNPNICLDEKPVIGIVTNAGSRWPMKSMSEKQYVDLINKIMNVYQKRVEIVLLPGPNDGDKAIQILMKCDYPVMMATPDTMETLIKHINRCDIIITPDTLPMHLGIALNKYVMAYFTITSAAETEIYNGMKFLPTNMEGYCSYSTESLPHPNVTDSIDVDIIMFELFRILDKE